MNHLDKLYHVKKLSGRMEAVEIVSTDPENEYLIHIRDLSTGEKRFIHKVFLKDWLPLEDGIQGEMFREDLTEKYKRLFKGK